MNRPGASYVIVLLSALVLAWGGAVAAPTVGWVDNAAIYPGNLRVHARMDSGTKTSSLRSGSTRLFKRNGKTWISVTVADRKGHAHTLERQVVRIAKIKRHEGPPARRPVILLGICVGHVYKEVDTTVASRSGFNYPLLVGRNFLAGSFLIDSSRTYTAKSSCKPLRR